MKSLTSLYLLPAAAVLALAASPCMAQTHTVGEPALLVTNQGDRTLSIIDPEAAKQIAAVPEGDITGHEVAASPDGRTAYVPIYGNSGVGHRGTDGTHMYVIDIASQKIVGNVDFGHGVRPHCVIYEPHSGMLYITTELDQAITIVDPRTLKIVGKIPTNQEQSHMLAISHDGRFGYTANVGPGTVSVLDLKKRAVITVIPISKNTQRISISRNDKMVFTSDQTKPQLAVIDTATNTVKDRVDLPGLGYGTASTKDGKWLLVAVPSKAQVAVVDLKTLKVARTIDVPRAPQEILVRPDGKVAYVSCNASHQVAAIDLKDWKVQSLIDAGKGADGLAWAR
jgi:DNA-binding beta-propeller fold protein YncE